MSSTSEASSTPFDLPSVSIRETIGSALSSNDLHLHEVNLKDPSKLNVADRIPTLVQNKVELLSIETPPVLKENQRLPSELVSLLKDSHGLSADKVNQLIRALGAAYQELSIKEIVYNDESRQPEEKLWSLEPEVITKAGEALHNGYKLFHVAYGVAEAMRPTEDPSEKINLTELPFNQLPPVWKDVNETSARHLMMIIEIMSKHFDFNEYYKDPDSPASKQLIFSINSALFEVWTNSGEKNPGGSLRNPLFLKRSYRNVVDVAKGGHPIEGWEAFLAAYKTYLAANEETYAKARLKYDTDGNKILDDDELKIAVQQDAYDELFKDNFMTTTFLDSEEVLKKLYQKN